MPVRTNRPRRPAQPRSPVHTRTRRSFGVEYETRVGNCLECRDEGKLGRAVILGCLIRRPMRRRIERDLPGHQGPRHRNQRWNDGPNAGTRLHEPGEQIRNRLSTRGDDAQPGHDNAPHSAP